MEYLFLLGRILLGGYFIINAINHFRNTSALTGYAQSKGVPSPKVAVLVGGALLLLGGLGIVLGLYIRFSALLLIVFLLPVTFKMHQYWKATDPMIKMGEKVNFQKNIALVGSVILLYFITSWPLSL